MRKTLQAYQRILNLGGDTSGPMLPSGDYDDSASPEIENLQGLIENLQRLIEEDQREGQKFNIMSKTFLDRLRAAVRNLRNTEFT